MSGTEDCASQEIDASTSSNSTQNSKKQIFLKSILNDNQVHLANRETRSIILGEKIPRFSCLEKRDFIENWILSHKPENSPEKSCPSPILGVGKRENIASPTLGYKRKRTTTDTKENFRINSNENSRFSRNRKSSGGLKNKTENTNSGFPVFDLFDDFDTTLVAKNSSALNFNTSTSTLNATRVSRRLLWTPSRKKSSDDDKSVNFNDHRNRDRESPKVTSYLNVSVPKEETKIEDRGTCRFSWRKGKNFGTKGSLEFIRKGDDDRESSKLKLSSSRDGKKISKDSKTENQSEELEYLRCRVKNSPTKLESESPSRWTGYNNEISEESKLPTSFSLNSPIIENDLMVIDSSSTDDPQENLNIDDRGKLSSRNSPYGARKIKHERELDLTPLKWNFRRSLLCESSKLPETLSLSVPLIETAGIVIESNSTDDPRENLNRDCQSRASGGNSSLGGKKFEKIESDSPLRWNGYGKEFPVSKLQETRGFEITENSLNSPEIIRERMVMEPNATDDPGQNLKVENQRNSSLRAKKGPTKVGPESPLRWNGYGNEILASKLPEASSLNSPEIGSERIIIVSNSVDDSRQNANIDNRRHSRNSRQSSNIDNQRNLSLTIKKSPLKFEWESPLRWTGYGNKAAASILPETLSLNSSGIKSQRIIIESNSMDDTRENLKIDNRRNFSLRAKKNSSKYDSKIPESSKLLETLSLTLAPIESKKMVAESISIDNHKENLKIDNQTGASSQKFVLGVEKSPTKFKSESPLRWNGYGNGIGEFSKLSETLPNSPLIKSQKVVDLKDDSNIEDGIGLSYGKSTNNIPVQREEKSPSRWNGYGNEICGFSKLPELPETLSNSPLIKTKKIANFKDDLSIDNRIVSPDSESKKIPVEWEEKSSLKWLGYPNREFFKIPNALSMSSQLIASERIAIESNFTNDPRDELKIDNQSQESSRKFGSVAKKSPLEIKSELAQMLNNHKIRESLKLPDTLSLSSQLIEHIDVESCTTNAPEDEIKIESDSDCTVSDLIENIVTQNSNILRERTIFFDKKLPENANRLESFGKARFEPGENGSYDSDETFCSNGESILLKVVHKERSSPEVISQKISQLTNNSRDAAAVSPNKSDIRISQANSPLKNNSGLAVCGPANNTMCNVARKKKKAKKGTLVAKLQSIINLQISNLNIWQHQMSLHNFKTSNTQFVTLRIRERETRYGRHFLIAEVIGDSHNLLNCFFPLENNFTISSQEKQTITLMIIPEINGRTKIQDESTIKIYPPWEIMDQHKRVLNIIYFDVRPKKDEINDFPIKSVESNRTEKIIEFDCPCIQRGAIDDTCQVKFTDIRPSVMQTMFG